MKESIYTELLEKDLNPFILFDSLGKIKSCNKEAEFLLNFVSIKELFELAISNASKNFGFVQKYISLQYNKQIFYAILVGYIDDEEIALRLYKVVSNQSNKINKDKLKLVNIYSLIDLSKSSILINSNLKLNELYDISIPEIKIDINNFLLCLNECFLYFSDDDEISLKVHIKIGEYEIIDDVKYKIVALEFIANRKVKNNNNLDEKATNANLNIFANENILTLELPAIL